MKAGEVVRSVVQEVPRTKPLRWQTGRTHGGRGSPLAFLGARHVLGHRVSSCVGSGVCRLGFEAQAQDEERGLPWHAWVQAK